MYFMLYEFIKILTAILLLLKTTESFMSKETLSLHTAIQKFGHTPFFSSTSIYINVMWGNVMYPVLNINTEYWH